MSLTTATLKAQARVLGFDLCGVAPAEAHPRLARLAAWLEAGRAGDMDYLAASAQQRADPRRLLPTARSVVSLGVVYNTPDADTVEPTGRVRIARYARGDDYHDVIRRRLRTLLQWMSGVADPGLEAISCVDTEPIQERVFAERAGLGWIGKNTCLINPTLGSWLFLAEVVTNVALAPDRPGTDQCGTCTRCLDACPTDAFVEPYELDATRCLAYVTIETRGEVDASMRPAVRDEVFGCDICQDVCPWNRRASTSDDPAWQTRPALDRPYLLDLCRMSDEGWRQVLAGSAMRRAGLARIRRSLAYACASRSTPAAIAALDALASHPSAQQPVVANAIEWARSSIDRP